MKTTEQLKRMKVGDSLPLIGATYEHKQSLYKAAYRADIKITIRKTPSGTTLWRVK